MSEAQTLEVEVTAIEQVTPLIKHFRLRPVSGEGMPPLLRRLAHRGGDAHTHAHAPQPPIRC